MKKNAAFLLALILFAACFLFSANHASATEMPAVPGDNALVLPLPSVLVNGSIEHENADHLDMNGIYYLNAGREDVRYYLDLCGVFGTYPCPFGSGGEEEFYALVSMDSDSIAEFYYLPEKSLIWIRYDADTAAIDDEGIAQRLSDLPSSAQLPDRPEEYVFPSFADSSGKQYQKSGTGSGLSFVYGGGEYRYEWYEEIDTEDIVRYTVLMRLLGMHVYADVTLFNDDGLLQMITLHYTDEAADVIVQFDSGLRRAVVYFAPDLDCYFMSEDEYRDAFEK